MRAALMVGLAVAALPAAAAAQEEGTRRPIVLTVRPGDRYFSLAWNPVPGSDGYTLRWRPAGVTTWQLRPIVGATRATVADVDNGMPMEFQVLDTRGRESRVVRRFARNREECGNAGRTFCAYRPLLQFLDSTGTFAQDLSCRGEQITRFDESLPDCAFDTPSGRLTLIRGADSVFTPRAEPLSVAEVRNAARLTIWPEGDPWVAPERFPAQIIATAQADTGRVRQAMRARSYLVQSSSPMTSRITLFQPRRARPGRVAIYHEGHGGMDARAVVNGAPMIDWLLSRGWTVVAMDMPLQGANAMLSSVDETHEDLGRTARTDADLLGPFLLPVKAVTDWLLGGAGGTEVSTLLLVGRSGGGWTSYVYGALDPRIDVVVSIAGGLPMSMRMRDFPADLGDVEQTQAQLYSVLEQEELMMAAGARGAFLSYSFKDPCCFRLKGDESFVRWMHGRARAQGRALQVHVDPLHPRHDLSAAGRTQLELFLNRVMEGEDDPMLARSGTD